MIGRRLIAVAAAVGLLVGCGNHVASTGMAARSVVPRRSVVWLGAVGLDDATALTLRRVGVDEVVVKRGVISMAGGAPVLRLDPLPPVSSLLPIGAAFTVENPPATLDPAMATALWRSLSSELEALEPAELILDLPRLTPGLAAFVTRLSQDAGLPVVPVLTPAQLREASGLAVANAAGLCLVPLAGAIGLVRPGAEPTTQTLADQLAPLAGTGTRVRALLVLRPQTVPELSMWAEDLNPVTEQGLTEISTSSELDRTFVFRRSTAWSGRTWAASDKLATAWMDAPRLNAALSELGRVLDPEVAGWDLVELPPPGPALGLGQEALANYLSGDGPMPELVVRPRRRGAVVEVELVNLSPFSSAVSGRGNYLEVAADAALIAEDSGSFDRIAFGTRRGGDFAAAGGIADAIRFYENYIGPRELLRSGPVRLPSPAHSVTVRWHAVLSTGEEIGGRVEVR